MAYQGIKSKTDGISTKRAPPKSRQSPPLDHDFADGSFPPAYDYAANGSAARALPKRLEPGLERLIDLAAGAIGCPPDEIADLKARAIDNPEPIAAYCQSIFDERIRRPREDARPAFPPDSNGEVLFWLEGIHGKALARAPWRPEIAPYSKATLGLRDVERSPFKRRRPSSAPSNPVRNEHGEAC